jgi:hypothetical protein
VIIRLPVGGLLHSVPVSVQHTSTEVRLGDKATSSYLTGRNLLSKGMTLDSCRTNCIDFFARSRLTLFCASV